MRLSLMLDAINNIETYMKGIEDYDDFAGNKIIFMPLCITFNVLELNRILPPHNCTRLLST